MNSLTQQELIGIDGGSLEPVGLGGVRIFLAVQNYVFANWGEFTQGVREGFASAQAPA